MKVLLQRVSQASVSVSGQVIGSIQRGLLLLVGLGQDDSAAKLKPMVEKLINLRVFPDPEDDRKHFHLSLLQIDGGALLVPQFTLFADTNKGRRPEFFNSMPPQAARELFSAFIETVKASGIKEVAQGEFGAHMHVALENDGPVTIMVEM